jgi:uncharacterized protein (TIGR02271 family)
MFESRADAERVQAELQSLGIIDADGMSIHDQSSPGFSGDSYSSHENRGLWASIKGAFLPDEDRHTYEEGIRRGHYLLTVSVDDTQADRVHDILENSSAVNVDERASQWRQEGWAAPAAGATGMGAMGTASAMTGTSGTATTDTTGTASAMMGTSGTATTGTTGYAASGVPTTGRDVTEERIPIIEEELRVGKREVARGGVRVRSYVVEQPVHEQVSLREEHVSVERRPVTGATDTANLGDAFRERTVEVTETAEEAVVDKRAHVVEEVVVRKNVDERVEQINDSVRRTEVDIDDQRGVDRLAARDPSLDRDDLGRDGMGRKPSDRLS